MKSALEGYGVNIELIRVWRPTAVSRYSPPRPPKRRRTPHIPTRFRTPAGELRDYRTISPGMVSGSIAPSCRGQSEARLRHEGYETPSIDGVASLVMITDGTCCLPGRPHPVSGCAPRSPGTGSWAGIPRARRTSRMRPATTPISAPAGNSPPSGWWVVGSAALRWPLCRGRASSGRSRAPRRRDLLEHGQVGMGLREDHARPAGTRAGVAQLCIPGRLAAVCRCAVLAATRVERPAPGRCLRSGWSRRRPSCDPGSRLECTAPRSPPSRR